MSTELRVVLTLTFRTIIYLLQLVLHLKGVVIIVIDNHNAYIALWSYNV